MATILELEKQWNRKRNLYYALIGNVSMARIKELIDGIPYDAEPSTQK
jgi:hypothetical protein